MNQEPVEITFKVYPPDGVPYIRCIKKRVIKIGRLESADLTLSHGSVGRLHVALEQSSDGIDLTNLSSPTKLNGNPVGRAMLMSGDTLAIGSFLVEVTFESPASNPSNPPTTWGDVKEALVEWFLARGLDGVDDRYRALTGLFPKRLQRYVPVYIGSLSVDELVLRIHSACEYSMKPSELETVMKTAQEWLDNQVW